MTLPIPGLRHKVYLAGHEFSHPPVQFGRLRPGVMESIQRLRGGKAVRDVALPYPGACVRPSKYVFTVGWDVFDATDAEAFESAIADDAETDFCPWLSRCERFRFLQGEPYAGTLQRRDGLTQCPILPGSVVGLAPRLEINGTPTAIVLGTVDADYHTPWTAAGTAGVGGATAVVWYMPMFRVLLSESEEQPDSLQRLVASCTLIEV